MSDKKDHRKYVVKGLTIIVRLLTYILVGGTVAALIIEALL